MNTTPIPGGVKGAILAAAYGLTAITAAANFGHGKTLARYAGQNRPEAILAASIPDVLLAVSITVLAFRPRQAWAWVSLAGSIGFVFWAAVVTSLAGFCLPTTPGCVGADPNNTTRILVAVWPLLAAIALAGIVASFAHSHAPASEEHLAEEPVGEHPVTAEKRGPLSDDESGKESTPTVPAPRPPFIGVPPTPLPQEQPTPKVAALKQTTPRSSTTATITEHETDLKNLTDDEISQHMLKQDQLPSIRTAKTTYRISHTRAKKIIEKASVSTNSEKHEDHQLESQEESASKSVKKSHLGSSPDVGVPSAAQESFPLVAGKVGDIK